MKLALTNKNGEMELVNWDSVVRCSAETGSRVFNTRIYHMHVDRMYAETHVKETTKEINALIDEKEKLIYGYDVRTKAESPKTRPAREEAKTM